MRVTIIGSYFSDAGNMGIDVLCSGAIKLILSRHPNAQISFLDYGKQADRRDVLVGGIKTSVELINIRFSKNVFQRNHIARLLLFAALLLPVRRYRWSMKLINSDKVLRALVSSDLVAALNGGDSFSDIYGLKRFFYVYLPQLLVVTLGKELILLPQTIGPFKGRLTKPLARFILKRVKRIYTRDNANMEDLARLLESRNKPSESVMHFCHDLGFLVEATEPANLNILGLPTSCFNSSMVIGINVSGLLFVGGYTQDNMFGLRFQYRKFVTELIIHLLSFPNACVLLIPHVYGGPSEIESDSQACSRVYEDMQHLFRGRIGFAAGPYTHAEIKYVIGRCFVLIASRLHACIAALSQGVPAVGIAYSDKFYGVFESVGMKSLVVDARTVKGAEIIELVDFVVRERDVIHARLLSYSRQVSKMITTRFYGEQEESSISRRLST